MTYQASALSIAQALLPAVRLLKHAEDPELGPQGIGPYRQALAAYTTAISFIGFIPGDRVNEIVAATVDGGHDVAAAISAYRP